VAVQVRSLRPDEVRAAVAVVARGMRDNPLHVAAYGENERLRLARHSQLIAGLFAASASLVLTGAFRGEVLAGVSGAAPPGTCRLGVAPRIRMLPALASLGPEAAARVLSWTRAWSRHDPSAPHVHLGPVAVDAHLQGHGIGTSLLADHCRQLDHSGATGYLETDKPENVTFYRRFGYAVVGRTLVLGVPNWFMARAASG
jgi:GNAT superfamily N-acetyltransferase